MECTGGAKVALLPRIRIKPWPAGARDDGGTERVMRVEMNTFLVALDASPRAPMVLDAAIALARPLGAKLVLYRSVSIPPEIPLGLYLGSSGSLEGLLVDNAEKDIEELAKKVPPELLAAKLVEIATPWDGICRVADAQKADLVVIGSHGYGGLDRLLGTTAAKVVNHTHCSVYVVRPAQ